MTKDARAPQRAFAFPGAWPSLFPPLTPAPPRRTIAAAGSEVAPFVYSEEFPPLGYVGFFCPPPRVSELRVAPPVDSRPAQAHNRGPTVASACWRTSRPQRGGSEVAPYLLVLP